MSTDAFRAPIKAKSNIEIKCALCKQEKPFTFGANISLNENLPPANRSCMLLYDNIIGGLALN